MYRWIISLILLLLLFNPSRSQEITPYPVPDWQTSSPEAQGMDSAQLATIFDEIATAHLNIHSILVIRNGYLVLEAYRHPYTPAMPHQINSVTKSITSALFGMALDQGYIESIDQPMLDFFPDRTVANMDDAKEAITLENLLTMTSGLTWRDELGNRGDLSALYASPDWLQFVLDRPMKAEPGKRFVYNSGVSNLLTAVMEQATRQDVRTFAKTYLFDPLGIKSAQWLLVDPEGHPFGGTGMLLSPRDMAKFGYLYLNNGNWNGEQIIPADWVEASTQKHIPARPVADGYGYQWWVSFRGYYMASGYGGQYIIVAPEQNLVVVFTADLPGAVGLQPDILFQTVILPAIKGDEPLPDNPAGVAALQAAIDAIQHPEPSAIPPLNATARRISGQVYKLQINLAGLETLTLAFTEGKGTARMVINRIGIVEIGLDNRFMVNQTLGTLPEFLKGTWTEENQFVIQIEGPSLPTAQQLALTFEDDKITIGIRDSLSGYVFTIKGTADQ
jgi:CubicO group peptidase (beta-lactamase class C family)